MRYSRIHVNSAYVSHWVSYECYRSTCRNACAHDCCVTSSTDWLPEQSHAEMVHRAHIWTFNVCPWAKTKHFSNEDGISRRIPAGNRTSGRIIVWLLLVQTKQRIIKPCNPGATLKETNTPERILCRIDTIRWATRFRTPKDQCHTLWSARFPKIRGFTPSLAWSVWRHALW